MTGSQRPAWQNFARDVLVWAGTCGMLFVAEPSWRFALALGAACFAAVRAYGWFRQAAAARGPRHHLAVRVAGWVALCGVAGGVLGRDWLSLVVGSIAYGLVDLAAGVPWD